MSTNEFVPNYVPPAGHALAGKVAVVTGGASGIGEAVARTFAANEAKVLVVDLDAERLAAVVGEIRSRGWEAEGYVGDVTSEEAVADVFA